MKKLLIFFLTQQRVSLHTYSERKGEEFVGSLEIVPDRPLKIGMPEKLVIEDYSRDSAILRAEAYPAHPDLKPHKVRLRAIDRAEKLQGLRDFLCERGKAGISQLFELAGTSCLCTLLPEKSAQPNEIIAVMYVPQRADLRQELGKRQREHWDDGSEFTKNAHKKIDLRQELGQKRQKEYSDQESEFTPRRLDETPSKQMTNHEAEGSATTALGSDEYEEYLKPGSYDNYLGSVSMDMRKKIEGKKGYFFKQLTTEPHGRNLLRDIWMDEEVGVPVYMHTHMVRIER